jgi:hypothetical protein
VELHGDARDRAGFGRTYIADKEGFQAMKTTR